MLLGQYPSYRTHSQCLRVCLRVPDHRPATTWVHCLTSCETQSSAAEDGQKICPKHVELIVVSINCYCCISFGLLHYLHELTFHSWKRRFVIRIQAPTLYPLCFSVMHAYTIILHHKGVNFKTRSLREILWASLTLISWSVSELQGRIATYTL